MLDVMCEISDPDDKLRMIVESSRQKRMMSAIDILPIPPLHSQHGLFRGLFRGVSSGSV